MPPAISTLPSGRKVWPPQNMSLGVWISLNVSFAGLHTIDSKRPALKLPWLFPEPATISTLPV